jgi:hypothetical protein
MRKLINDIHTYVRFYYIYIFIYIYIYACMYNKILKLYKIRLILLFNQIEYVLVRLIG